MGPLKDLYTGSLLGLAGFIRVLQGLRAIGF